MKFSSHIDINHESLPESDALETSKTTTSPFSFSTFDTSSVHTRQHEESAKAKFMKTLAICTSNPLGTPQKEISWDDEPATVPALVAANVDTFQFLSMSIQEIRILLSQYSD